MFKKFRGISLFELIISIIIMSLIILGIYNIEAFSTSQVIDSDRRARVQNDLAYVLEHMSKYIQQANGDKSDPANPKPAIVQTGSGFQVRVDFRDPQIPSDLDNGAWVSYSLDSSLHTLSTSCSVYGTGTCGSFISEILSNKIIGNFVGDTIIPDGATDGFYVNINPSGNLVDIGLVGRWDPGSPVITGTRFVNPQVEMKTRIISNSSSGQ